MSRVAGFSEAGVWQSELEGSAVIVWDSKWICLREVCETKEVAEFHRIATAAESGSRRA